MLHQHFDMVTLLKQAGARLTVSNTDFMMVLPQLEGFTASRASVKLGDGPQLTRDRIAIVQARSAPHPSLMWLH